MKRLVVLDERGNWHGPLCKVARARGYETVEITRGVDAPREGGGLGFIRPHADPAVLKKNKEHDWPFMHERLTMVQDATQVELYEDKSAQFWRFGQFMPPTWRFDNREKAIEFARREAVFPIVSKADVGASSVNVRIIPDRKALIAHIVEAFGRGIAVDHCAGGGARGRRAASKQKGYVLLQEFIPHTVTWRVNRIGDHFAIFKRYCGKDGKAQTGNVEPVKVLDPLQVALLGYALRVSDEIKTKWAALDILVHGDTFKLLETSLAWPWPSPGDCMSARFFGVADRRYEWSSMWDLMLDEYERGVFDANTLAAHV